ncbi:hypothetical protein [Mycobacterium sp. 1081908.1]|uniref:hypothetical protein n=1 Tax=Mycobacterium sp. 1081908.1 TaxID=1834066 RepID=UPI0008019C5B|nr:hypothetical protein [Mycobacterium sp. 1081908.1]OBK45511.1 hypothetical protein A5655_11790 [Mycobacterium sp. 1081908.1]
MELDLPAPSGATRVDEWGNFGAAFRVYDGPEWRIKRVTDRGRGAQSGDIVVSVIGRQYMDGRAECEIILDGPHTPVITPTEARKLSSALIAAADAADG